MTRPFLDKLATTLFTLEQSRVSANSEVDESGREGEPMAWAEADSLANRVSTLSQAGPAAAFKQWVADIVAVSV